MFDMKYILNMLILEHFLSVVVACQVNFYIYVSRFFWTWYILMNLLVTFLIRWPQGPASEELEVFAWRVLAEARFRLVAFLVQVKHQFLVHHLFPIFSWFVILFLLLLGSGFLRGRLHMLSLFLRFRLYTALCIFLAFHVTVVFMEWNCAIPEFL